MPKSHLVLVLAALITPLYSATIVLPNGFGSTVANDDSGPLSGSFAGSFINQHIWDATQLGALNGGVLITQIAYRMKPGTGSINATSSAFSIYLSTSPNSVATTSTTFAKNRGSDFTQVFSGSGTIWSSPGCAGPAVCPFDIVYTLSTPFLFNPSNGSLLVEDRFADYIGTGTGRFDVQHYLSALGAAVSHIDSTGALEYSNNVTRLTFNAVPEPGAFLLTTCGLGVLAALRRKAS